MFFSFSLYLSLLLLHMFDLRVFAIIFLTLFIISCGFSNIQPAGFAAHNLRFSQHALDLFRSGRVRFWYFLLRSGRVGSGQVFFIAGRFGFWYFLLRSGRVGSGFGIFFCGRVGSGRVRYFLLLVGSGFGIFYCGRVGSGRVGYFLLRVGSGRVDCSRVLALL